MDKYLISKEMFSDLRMLYRANVRLPTTATPEIIAKYKEANDILDAGPIDMSDEAMHKNFYKTYVGSYMMADGSVEEGPINNDQYEAWEECWQYLRDKMEGKL